MHIATAILLPINKFKCQRYSLKGQPQGSNFIQGGTAPGGESINNSKFHFDIESQHFKFFSTNKLNFDCSPDIVIHDLTKSVI